MRTVLTGIAALIALLIFLNRLQVGHSRLHLGGPGALTTRSWLANLLVGLSLILHIESVQTSIGNLSGLSNLGWFLAYALGTTGFCCAAYVFLHLRSFSPPIWRLVAGLFWLVQVTMLVLYLGWIVDMPEWPERIPRLGQEAFFMGAFFGYGAVTAIASTVALYRIARQDRYLIVRLRAYAGLSALVFALVFFALKIAWTAAAFRQPDLALVEFLNELVLATMAVTALLSIVNVLPHSAYAGIVELVRYGEKIEILWRLRSLQARLLQLCPPVVWEEISLWEQIREIDFHLYRTAISILDSHRILDGYLQRLENSGEDSLVIESGDRTIHWHAEEIREAEHLRDLLQVHADTEYESLLRYYREASRQLRNRHTFAVFQVGLSAFLSSQLYRPG